jgi:regulator of sigma E protease
MYIVIAILLFSFLIFIHEFGHFTAAKLSKVQVNEFALFMGPKILSKKVGETTYRLNCIPIGGYCAMEGEDGDSDNPRAFTAAKVWKRLIILCAGSFMNFLAGFLIVVILTAASGGHLATANIVQLEPDSDLTTAGFEVGDEFYAIDGEKIYISQDISTLLDRNSTGVYDIVVIRDGEKVTFDNISLERKTFNGESSARFGMILGGEKKTVGSVLSYSWNNCKYFARLVRFGLSDLITGRASINEMSGPVGVVAVVNEAGEASETTSQGVMNVLYLFAFIAVNLAIMNMLPIPALDGGRVVCLLLTWCIEKIIRKKLNPKIEAYIHGIGMILLWR